MGQRNRSGEKHRHSVFQAQAHHKPNCDASGRHCPRHQITHRGIERQRAWITRRYIPRGAGKSGTNLCTKSTELQSNKQGGGATYKGDGGRCNTTMGGERQSNEQGGGATSKDERGSGNTTKGGLRQNSIITKIQLTII